MSPRGPLELGLPFDASTHGALVDALLAENERFDFLLLGLMVALIAFVLVRFGRRHKASPIAETRRSRMLVVAVALGIFVLIDGALLFGSERVMRTWLWNFEAIEANPQTVRIEVNAHQWAWDFRYAGADGAFNSPDDPLSWNEVRIPLGRPVHFQLASTDVIHAFALPNFRVQTEVIPGRIQHVWIEAKALGRFEIACSQHCGASHYKMRGVLEVMAPDDFERWARTASQRAGTAHDPEDPGQRWGWAWRRP